MIAAVEGRQDDVCQFIAHDGTPRPFFPDTIRRAILLASPQILDYRATQERPGHLHVALATAPTTPFASLAAEVRASIISTSASYACRPPDLTIEDGLPPAEAGVKRRRVRRVG